ncbi:MAG TPA: TolC family protein, partial [Hyphomonadaceae bacterium]|nr:TolC family protein [Hyphomonadaceae bacterium]
ATGSLGEARRFEKGPYEWALSGSYQQRSIAGLGDFGEYDLGVTRGFRLPGKSHIDTRIGQHSVSAAKNAAEDARHQAALLLMGAWLEWLAAREIDAINDEQLASFEKELDAVEKRLLIDDAAAIDVEMARSALAETRAALARSRGQVSRTHASLVALFPDLPLPGTPPPITGPHLPRELERLRLSVVQNSHEIGYADDLALRAGAVADKARADRVPDPQLGLRVFSERGGDETGVGLTFSIPIGGGAREAIAHEQLAAASAARQVALRVRREVADIAEADAIQAQSEYEAWQSARAGLDDSARIVQRLRDGYAIGASSLIDLLAAERRFLGARLLEQDARTRAHFAILKIQIDAHEMWLD